MITPSGKCCDWPKISFTQAYLVINVFGDKVERLFLDRVERLNR